MKSIRRNITLAILLPVIILLLTFGVKLIFYVNSSVTEHANEKMESTSVEMAEMLDNTFESLKVRMQMMRAGMNQMVEEPKLLAKDMAYFKGFEDTMGRILKQSIDGTPGLYSSYFRFDPNLTYGTAGIVYISDDADGVFREDPPSDLSKYSPTDEENVGWYYTPMKAKNPIWLEPFYDVTVDKTILSYVVPFYLKNGQDFGLVAVDFNVDQLNTLVEENRKYSTGDIFIINEEGKILYHPDYTEGENLFEIREGKYSSFKDRILSSDRGHINEKIGKETVLAGYSVIKSNGWKICIFPSKEEIYGSVYKVRKGFLIYMLISALIVYAIAYVLSHKISRPIVNLTKKVKSMAEGNWEEEIKVESRTEIGELSKGLQELVAQLKNYRNYIGEISESLMKIGNGDLNIDFTYSYNGEFCKIKDSLLRATDMLNTTLSECNFAADQVLSGSDQVSSGAQELAQGATEQAESIDHLSKTIGDISDKITRNANNAQMANSQVMLAGQEVVQSNSRMQEMIHAMENISLKSVEISKIVKTIDDIAFQTNILALNAAVEAARAGASGKGFAVVADEVRNLAQKSADAARNTTILIEETVGAIRTGTEIADNAAKSMQSVVEAAEKVTVLINEIADASNEQSAAVSEVTNGIEQISDVVRTNSATAEESAAASEELNGQAQMLKNQISKFHLKVESGKVSPKTLEEESYVIDDGSKY